MLIPSKTAEQHAILQVAELMVAAARTAPKGRGVDEIETCIVTGDDKDKMSAEMRKLSDELNGEGPFLRDAGNVDKSECVVLIATRSRPRGLTFCSKCGKANCGEAVKAGIPCVFNSIDLGIALGSAASVAADHRIDNRIFYSAGEVAERLKIFSETATICFGIPLSVSGKSPYFDREKKNAK
jgi:uncharacterized ferredoxin-like protein